MLVAAVPAWSVAVEYPLKPQQWMNQPLTASRLQQCLQEQTGQQDLQQVSAAVGTILQTQAV